MKITRFVLVAVVLVTGGCGAPAAPTATVATSPTIPVSTGAASPSPVVETAAPTLAATSEEASSAPPGAISVDMGAFGPPRYVPDQVTVRTGEVVFFLRNVGDRYEGFHDFVIGPALYQALARSPALEGGDAVIFTIEDLPRGDYTFWCEIERHASLGMVGTLTVDP